MAEGNCWAGVCAMPPFFHLALDNHMHDLEATQNYACATKILVPIFKFMKRSQLEAPPIPGKTPGMRTQFDSTDFAFELVLDEPDQRTKQRSFRII
jgi:hypothetical protein